MTGLNLRGGQPPQRRTRQRAAVAAIMAETTDFKTAQQIHELLKAAGEQIGLTTVYRTLQSMTEAGEVDVIRTETEAAYRRCETEEHHHHLVCRNCGHTVEIAGPTVERWAAKMASEHGFREVGHELEIFGLCENC